jgi:hypothetical protein
MRGLPVGFIGATEIKVATVQKVILPGDSEPERQMIRHSGIGGSFAFISMPTRLNRLRCPSTPVPARCEVCSNKLSIGEVAVAGVPNDPFAWEITFFLADSTGARVPQLMDSANLMAGGDGQFAVKR